MRYDIAISCYFWKLSADATLFPAQVSATCESDEAKITIWNTEKSIG
jgi:hypothetical protein